MGMEGVNHGEFCIHALLNSSHDCCTNVRSAQCSPLGEILSVFSSVLKERIVPVADVLGRCRVSHDPIRVHSYILFFRLTLYIFSVSSRCL
jgi:hypothetical protein